MSHLQIRLNCVALRKWKVTILFVILGSMSLPMLTCAQNRFVSPPKAEQPDSERDHEIDGKTIVNTPNHNSSSKMYNMPYVYIPRNKLVALGQPCDWDSDCANYSLCLLQVFEPERRIKACQCDETEMLKLNNSCYIKPGHQCYYPNKNSHGYAFIQCYPGSICMESVNKTAPGNGYCMCTSSNQEYQFRELNVEFETHQCGGASSALFIKTFEVIVFMGLSLLISSF